MCSSGFLIDSTTVPALVTAESDSAIKSSCRVIEINDSIDLVVSRCGNSKDIQSKPKGTNREETLGNFDVNCNERMKE